MALQVLWNDTSKMGSEGKWICTQHWIAIRSDCIYVICKRGKYLFWVTHSAWRDRLYALYLSGFRSFVCGKILRTLLLLKEIFPFSFSQAISRRYSSSNYFFKRTVFHHKKLIWMIHMMFQTQTLCLRAAEYSFPEYQTFLRLHYHEYLFMS